MLAISATTEARDLYQIEFKQLTSELIELFHPLYRNQSLTIIMSSNQKQTNQNLSSIEQVAVSKDDQTHITCDICTESIETCFARLEKCGHLFDYHCIQGWLRRNHNSCPTCRQTINYLTYVSSYNHGHRTIGLLERLHEGCWSVVLPETEITLVVSVEQGQDSTVSVFAREPRSRLVLIRTDGSVQVLDDCITTTGPLSRYFFDHWSRSTLAIETGKGAKHYVTDYIHLAQFYEKYCRSVTASDNEWPQL